MSDPLDDLLRSCCVSINGCGTGFFVASNFLVTCHHVPGGSAQPGSETDVVSDSLNCTYKARLVWASPIQDLAIFETQTFAPFHVLLGSSAEELVSEERLLIVGHPEYEKSIRELGSISVVYDGGTDGPGIRRVQFRANQVVPGFSGSPLLNLHTGNVIGVVKETRGAKDALGGWAIPIETVIAQLHNLNVKTEASPAVSNDWHEALEKRQQYLGDSVQFRQPFFRTVIEHNSNNIYYYGSEKIPFLGRRNELRRLKGFLEAPAQFAWFLITGPGGSGKSRLALQFCAENCFFWRGGFLPSEDIGNLSFWQGWRPSRPTLLIADYAAPQATALGELARRLRAKTGRPRFPIRLLLIERDIGGLERNRADQDGWFDRFLGKGMSDREITLGAQYSDPEGGQLALGNLSEQETWTLIQSVAPSRFSEKNRLSTFQRLKKIDPEGRALFAMFVAASASGATDQFWVLREVLDKEKKMHWEPAGVTEEDLALAAVATMCGGAPRSALQHHSARIDAALAQFSLRRYQAITGNSARLLLSALEPDVLGEWFVLESLCKLDALQISEFSTTAWAANMEGTYGFLLKSIPDFPEHGEVLNLIKPPALGPRPLEAWASALVELLRHMPARHHTLGTAMFEEIKAVACHHSGQKLLYELHSRATLNLMLLCERSQQFERAKSLKSEFEKLISKHPNPAFARNHRARLLGREILQCAQETEEELARPLRDAPFTFLGAVTRMEIAQAAFDEFQALCAEDSSNEDFQTQYAAAAYHLILGYSKPGHVFDRIWYPAALLVKDVVSKQLQLAMKAYKQVTKFATAHPQSKEARVFTARAASCLSAAFANMQEINDITRRRDELVTLSSRFADEPDLRFELARAIYNLVYALHRQGDIARARKECLMLRTLREAHPTESFIAERLSRAEKMINGK